MIKEAFVYIWNNLTDDKKYVGYHKGTNDDGYVASSHNKDFWDDFYDSKKKWKRDILYRGSVNECLEYEQEYLKNVNIRSNKWYNNARGKKIIWTESVKTKASKSQKERWKNMTDEEKKDFGKRVSQSNKGKVISIEVRNKISKKLTGRKLSEEHIKKSVDGNRGHHYHSDEYKKVLSDKMKGNGFGKYQTKETREKKRKRFLENNPGKNKTEEHIKKISESKKGSVPWNKGKKRKQVECSHCGKIGGDGLMQRWHFDNCKYK